MQSYEEWLDMVARQQDRVEEMIHSPNMRRMTEDDKKIYHTGDNADEDGRLEDNEGIDEVYVGLCKEADEKGE